MEGLGMIIRKRRLELKLKVYELAKLVEVDPVYISQIEIHDKLPAPALFEKIRKVLKLDEQVKNLYLHKKLPDIFTSDSLKSMAPGTDLAEAKAGYIWEDGKVREEGGVGVRPPPPLPLPNVACGGHPG